VRYGEAIASAPPGSDSFTAADVARLAPPTLRLLLQPGPAAPPLEDVAAALGPRSEALHGIACVLAPARGERLLRLSQRPVSPAQRAAAGGRLVRGLFWPLAYELAPEMWDRLASAEQISPQLLADLPADGALVLDVGAGTGRLAAALAPRAALTVAVEPSEPLRRRLRQRCPAIRVVAAHGHRLPIASASIDLVVSCATFGPDPPVGGEAVRAELERCGRPGGAVALVQPEEPAWWQDRGYTLLEYPAPEVRLDPDVEAFFGPGKPPRRLLIKRL
jgi:hypothetical protein